MPTDPARTEHPNPISDAFAGQSAASRALSVTFAALLGVFVLGGVGFSHISAIHNAAHDVRHANAFPCH